MSDSDKKISVWKGPVLIGFLSLIGLFVALIADSFFDYVSVALLSVPVVYSMVKLGHR
ncbi:MAG: hypothetical protein WEB02_04970 [Methylophaga sp.]